MAGTWQEDVLTGYLTVDLYFESTPCELSICQVQVRELDLGRNWLPVLGVVIG